VCDLGISEAGLCNTPKTLGSRPWAFSLPSRHSLGRFSHQESGCISDLFRRRSEFSRWRLEMLKKRLAKLAIYEPSSNSWKGNMTATESSLEMSYSPPFIVNSPCGCVWKWDTGPEISIATQKKITKLVADLEIPENFEMDHFIPTVPSNHPQNASRRDHIQLASDCLRIVVSSKKWKSEILLKAKRWITSEIVV
jgi:hypothetical protein